LSVVLLLTISGDAQKLYIHLNSEMPLSLTGEESKMVTGTVKFFNRTKHFGFVAGDDGTDYFVHVSGLKPGVTIDEGDKVTFDVVAGDRGPKAENVEKAA